MNPVKSGMKVSIIMVCLNSKSTIEKSILSVLNQTYFNIEFIVMDGGSKDGTVEIIAKFLDRIDVFSSENDDGLYDAMNKGIRKASGDLIGILNTDDIFLTNYVIEEVVNFHHFNEIDASIGNILQHTVDGKVVRIYSSKLWSPFKLKFGFMPPHPSIYFRRELFEKFGGYDLSFIIAADYELITRYFLKYNIVWKYSGITTTSMMIGGLSSSGLSSYNLISNEIQRALKMNDIKFISFAVHFRFIWKLFGRFKAKLFHK